MTSEPSGQPGNTIRGGIYQAPVIQATGDVDASFHLPAAAPVALAQLPLKAADFTGRDEDMAKLAGLLDPVGGAAAVVVSAVTGLAGVGKTTLAVQAGHAAVRRGWFGGGVLFIDLHGYDQEPVKPSQALDALLRALGVPAEHIPATVEERAALYRSAMAQITDPVLVIADNASSDAQVKPLLPGTGCHRVLVTSRHTLAGLGARLLDVTVLDDDAAIELLDTALRTARPDDDRVSGDQRAARRLARACGGLPLALQIIAALLNTDLPLSASDLADQLAVEAGRLERLRYDDGGGAGAPSVAAAFEMSYRKLDETQAREFRLLAFNPGPGASTAAISVLADLPVSNARSVLADLARAHLVEAAPGTADRWRMHDLVRIYGQRLSDAHAEADGREQACDRLLGYYLYMARAADDHLRALPGKEVPAEFTGRDAALDWLDTERASLVAAVTMAAATGRDQAALRLPLRLASYLDWRRRVDDWLATTTISVDAARRLGDRGNEGIALNNLGLALRQARRFDEAIATHQEAAAIFRKTGERRGDGGALNNLGLALQEVGRVDEAITAHKEAAAIHRDTGDRLSEGRALNNLGLALREVRRFEEAVAAHQEDLAICRESGDSNGESGALNNLGMALQNLHRFEEAVAAHEEDLAICRETADRHGEGTALNNLALALQNLRRFDEAITAHQDAEAIFHETDDQYNEAFALNGLGIAFREVQRFEEAIVACRDAVAIFHKTSDDNAGGIALEMLTRLAPHN